LACATYLIDKLALRVGNEKGEDEADTVGCCSLRVEHIQVLPENVIAFDFLGKDSMRYHHEHKMDERAHTAIARFVKNKDPKADLFDRVKASDLNEYLKNFMPDLSAKVFRTYNASKTLQEELEREEFNKKSTIE